MKSIKKMPLYFRYALNRDKRLTFKMNVNCSILYRYVASNIAILLSLESVDIINQCILFLVSAKFIRPSFWILNSCSISSRIFRESYLRLFDSEKQSEICISFKVSKGSIVYSVRRPLKKGFGQENIIQESLLKPFFLSRTLFRYFDIEYKIEPFRSKWKCIAICQIVSYKTTWKLWMNFFLWA